MLTSLASPCELLVGCSASCLSAAARSHLSEALDRNGAWAAGNRRLDETTVVLGDACLREVSISGGAWSGRPSQFQLIKNQACRGVSWCLRCCAQLEQRRDTWQWVYHGSVRASYTFSQSQQPWPYHRVANRSVYKKPTRRSRHIPCGSNVQEWLHCTAFARISSLAAAMFQGRPTLLW